MTAEKMNIAECKKTVKSIVTKVLVLVLAILFTSIVNIRVWMFLKNSGNAALDCTRCRSLTKSVLSQVHLSSKATSSVFDCSALKISVSS